MDNIPKKFLSLVINKELRDIFYEYSEIAIDCILDDENMERIPIVSTLTKGGKVVLSFRDRIFIKKVGRFLSEAENINPALIEKYYAELESDDAKYKVGEALLTMLDRIDDEEKARIVGYFFTKRVQGELSESWFRIMTNAIEKIYITDIHTLRNGYKNPCILENQIGEIFVPYRIIDRKVKLISAFRNLQVDGESLGENDIKVEYSLSNLGRKFVKYLNEYSNKKF
ncbi:hypothetical protein [Saccharophagus degradans]|uniref:Uncharacterized protein n=1 Tax=Saccharophagus degradans TaxID=86304 RepID=A0AAW7X7P1_9GAMM|nr:hypothetical protein [Saccharophagus degradans]MDO6422746.1 hypothetical protein [Saccharophagus degradans]MDO6606219.1 hypothetical protein [Saccharophagus degradans]